MEIRDSDLRLSKICPAFGWVESSFGQGDDGSFGSFDVIFSLLATLMDGPVLVWWMLMQCGLAAVSRVVSSGTISVEDGGGICLVCCCFWDWSQI